MLRLPQLRHVVLLPLKTVLEEGQQAFNPNNLRSNLLNIVVEKDVADGCWQELELWND